jgi:hypothetical protein
MVHGSLLASNIIMSAKPEEQTKIDVVYCKVCIHQLCFGGIKLFSTLTHVCMF